MTFHPDKPEGSDDLSVAIKTYIKQSLEHTKDSVSQEHNWSDSDATQCTHPGLTGISIDTFNDIIGFQSIDGFTATTDGTGAVTPLGNVVRLATGTTIDDDTILVGGAAFPSSGFTNAWGGYEFGIISIASIANVEIYMVMIDSVITSQPDGTSDRYYGFKIINNDISAVYADGTTETATDTTIDISAATAFNRFRVIPSATDAKFYVHGVLQATQTADHPGISTNFYPAISIRTKIGSSKTCDFTRIMLSIPY